jgi:hypothetical protein
MQQPNQPTDQPFLIEEDVTRRRPHLSTQFGNGGSPSQIGSKFLEAHSREGPGSFRSLPKRSDPRVEPREVLLYLRKIGMVGNELG